MEEEFELIMSPLCQKVTRNDYTVEVHIYGDGENGWILEVVDEAGGSTVWNESFATDELALAEFRRTLDREGIQSFEAG